MNTKRQILLSAVLASALASNSQVSINVDASNPGIKVGYGYTQFKKSIREYQYSHNLSFHNTYIPGEKIQIDFADDALWLTDPKTDELTKVVGLVFILPYSGLGFAKAMYNVSMENFFVGISDAFSYFSGTTRIAKSDNMQQWVKKYDRYEPAFNDAAIP